MKNSIIIVAIIFSIAIIVLGLTIGNSYKYKYEISNTINVTGNAKKDFESDLVKWTAYYSRKSADLSQASEKLKEDRVLVRDFLLENGIKEDEISFKAIDIRKDYTQSYDNAGNSYSSFSGYVLTQYVSVESQDLDKVTQASREISELISKEVELSSNPPSYFYSRLEDLKLELISQASENAKARADNIAKESSAKIKSLSSADLGVFQITGQNDNEDFSYGGVFNTSSRNKTAHITVKARYLLK